MRAVGNYKNKKRDIFWLLLLPNWARAQVCQRLSLHHQKVYLLVMMKFFKVKLFFTYSCCLELPLNHLYITYNQHYVNT